MQHNPSPQPPAPSPQPPAPSPRPTRIAIAVVEHQGRFLIGQRPPGVPLAGLWEFPGGKIEVGETPEQAAARECREEAGLEVIVGEPFPRVVHQYDHDRVDLHFLACQPVNPQAVPRPPFRWVERARLVDYHFPAANDGLIRYLCSQPLSDGSPWDSRR